VRFSLTGDQLALLDAVRELLVEACPPAVVREAWPTAVPAPAPAAPSRVDALWSRLAAMGLLGSAVPESRGGLGLTETDLVPVLFELGYAAVPLPVAETMAVAGPLLGALDPAGQLSDLLAGRLRVALAGPTGLVAFGGRADLVLACTGTAIRLVSAAAATPVSTVDGSLAMTRLDPAADGTLIDDPDLAGLTALRGDLALAAQLVGLGRRMLDLTTSYVVTRRQFGVPVGSFQAVKHRLADALLRLEFAVPAVLAAGWAVATRSGTAGRDVSLAAVLAAEAAQDVAKAAIQCHGAIGYTVDYDLHLYAKRAWALAAAVGVDAHLTRLAEFLDLA
jgi:alkylation response protein AidB-like acyl-CoA dehydrogenase